MKNGIGYTDSKYYFRFRFHAEHVLVLRHYNLLIRLLEIPKSKLMKMYKYIGYKSIVASSD